MAEQQTQQVAPKTNKVYAFIWGMVAVATLWLVASQIPAPVNYLSSNIGDYDSVGSAPSYSLADSKSNVAAFPVANMTQTRKVTTNYLSVHVADVSRFHLQLTDFVESIKGKVMNEYVTVSTDDQSESGTMTVLVPNKDASAFFNLVSSNVIKVVDRQISSYEITQEYTDIARQLAQYEETYAKILKFYDKAKTVSELIEVQSQLTMVQQNIDSLKGRKMALDELSSNTQYTIYSSTNEFNLPYVPQGTFEFAKTFKLAVRSLIAATDKLTTLVIYLVVFAPLIAVGVLVVWGVRRHKARKQ